MSARAYTMKEMRAIVEYLVERKAYSEVRGRKMWMDYASSGLTTRSWQSLKETFLKRILPDIHNPYYKLSPESMRSFREGKDVTNKIGNKLEFRNSADGIHEAEEVKPSTSASVAENGTGEDNIHSNLSSDRESTETIILNIREEEIPDDSEDNQNGVNEDENTRKKSLRDCITFTEPLTPMLQEILYDFDSDEDDLITINKDSLEDQIQELNSDKSNKKDKEEKVKSTEKSKDKEKEEKTGSSNDSPKKTKAAITITVTTANKADKSPQKTEKVDDEPDEKNKKTGKDNVPTSDETRKKKETKVNGIDSNIAETGKKSLRSRKSSQIPEESQPTPTDSNKSDINTSVPDSLLPNNQEGLLNRLSITEDSKQKAAADSPPNLEDKPTASPKAQEQAKKSSKSQDKTKKKFKTTLRKRDPVEQTDIAEKDTKQEISKASNTQTEVDGGIISIESENTSNAKRVEKVDSDIPNNLVESDPKIPEIIAPGSVKEQEKAIEKVDAKKKYDSAVEIKASQSQPLSNPCLQSVSLYEDNLQENSSNESDLLLMEPPKAKSVTDLTKEEVAKNEEKILFLDSNSDTEDKTAQSPPKTTNVKVNRKRILNNLFAKDKDAVKRKRRRFNSQRSNPPPVRHSDSSDWTSTESDCSYVSPPRSRGRYSKKVLKPVSSRLLSLEQEGGLFVACGKKIYPLIDDSNGIKTFLSYIPEEDSGDEEAKYWKLKYVEERKKTAELTKLFEELQNSRPKKQLTMQINSPILPSKPVKINNGTIDNNLDDDDSEVSKIIVAKQVEKIEPIREDEKTVKIKYAKNNEEISLEGQWPNVQVILKDVMQLIHKDRPNDEVIAPVKSAEPSAPQPIVISGSTTPDEEVRRKVTDLEDSILQEIQERDKLEENGDEKQVTEKKRKGRSKKREAPSPQVAIEPKTRRSKQLETANVDNKNDTEIIVNEAKLKPIEPEVASSPVQKSGRSKRVATQAETSKQNLLDKEIVDEDSEILYRFPSPQPSTTETMNVDDENYKNTKKPLTQLRQPVPLSPESTLGYQDSDGGPVFEVFKKKKLLSTIECRNKKRRNIVRKSYEYSNSDASNECSISLPSAPQEATKIENSSLNTEAYRTDSYQILMPMTKQVHVAMDQIQEASPCPNEMDSIADTNSLNLSPASQNMHSNQDKSSSSISIHLNTEPASSSSVSLPLSPELSIVENISISKSNMNICEQPTLNEIQANEDSLSLTFDKFALSQVDITMPLMEQECQLRKSDVKNSYSEITYEPIDAKILDGTNTDEKDKNFDLDINSNKRGNTVSETLLYKLDTVTIGDNPSFASSLDGHMKKLLLESAKKAKPIRKSMRGKENTLFNVVMEVNNAEANKNKTKQKKRCSTPRKRQNIVKSQTLSVDGVIEEETTESCVSGRKSCPAVFSTVADELHTNSDSNKSKSPDHVTVRNPKKPKQIIRVKILRPKPKKSLNKTTKSDGGRLSKQSVRTDSGINDSTCSRSLNLNETVELIHNHSETCLQASECLDSHSLQILSPSRSIISLTTSSMELEDGMDKVSIMSQESSGLPPEMFCSDARDGSVAMKATIESKPQSQNSAYHTPPASVSSNNSLITEDLSDEIPRKQKGDWFLFSDEDATVSNLAPAPNTVDNSLYNAYLKRLFPVTCAVPDLSTITEASKDTDSQSRQNPTVNTAEFKDLLCSELSGDDDFLSCQN